MRPEDFGFVGNATDGVNAVLRSMDLRAGDELLTTDHVYHAIRQAMRYVAGRAGATVRELPVPLPVESADQIANAVLAGLSPRTRLLVIDHVTSPTALVFPIERIIAGSAERGVDVLVDGAHAPGMLPLDVGRLGAAYYAGNLHKWVCAPKGSAFLWARPDLQANVHPLVISHFLSEGFTRRVRLAGDARRQRLCGPRPARSNGSQASAGTRSVPTTTSWPSGDSECSATGGTSRRSARSTADCSAPWPPCPSAAAGSDDRGGGDGSAATALFGVRARSAALLLEREPVADPRVMPALQRVGGL